MVSDTPKFLLYLNSDKADPKKIKKLMRAEPVEHHPKEEEILEDRRQQAPIVAKDGKPLKTIPRKP
jgi:hypothetical protein